MAEAREKKRLRVLLFTNLFPNPVDRTRGIFTEQLARELMEISDVTVVCPLPWFPRWSFLKRFPRWYEFAEVLEEYTINGVQVHSPKYVIFPRISEPLLGMLMFLGTYFTVRRMHREKPFDVINSMWLYPDSVAAGWIAKHLGIPMVPTALGCDVNRMLKESAKRKQILGMLARSPSITAVSDGLRDGMVANGIAAANISIIPNGVNNKLFHLRDKRAMRAELDLPAGEKIILYVGRLSEEKGLPTLIEAAAILKKQGSSFLLCLVGDGPLMADLRARVDALGLAGNVRFLGMQNHAAIASWMGACDVFCLPSLREGCPNVVNEALASGRPVVASRVGGIPDMVDGSTGILPEAEDIAGFAAALQAALYERQWNPQQIADSMSDATWMAAAKRYDAAYRAAIANA